MGKWFEVLGILVSGVVAIAVGLWIRELHLAMWIRMILCEVAGITLLATGCLVSQQVGKILASSTKNRTYTHKENPYENKHNADSRLNN